MRRTGRLSRGDEVLVAECDNHRVQVFYEDGTFLRTWGSFGSHDGEFYYPSKIVVTQDGRVLVGDRDRIQEFE